ncbi:SPX domain-containing 4 [Micractinium conductrix]|uniref:SPX domain-containing 4 n=1 Tax=Micractinium conductrix TaxID=554055 RepID=A0A2P6VJJ9_9CHLO|nr:SPX domain-containing 4 [Micractinium conductrix]|eukprot:PSC74275.1 SPX domain-containing 4 [Micractinium conductrix]
MKFGHTLKAFADESDVPASALLNYKKLKKLIKAQRHNTKEEDGDQPSAASAPAAAGAGTSDDDDGQQPQPQAAAQQADAAAGGTAAVGPAAGASNGEQTAAGGATDADGANANGVAEEDREFITTLNEDLSGINTYYMEKEEEAVIRLRVLEDKLRALQGAAGAGAAAAAADGGGGAPARGGGAAAAAELDELRNQMVDFHGELVLLLHWSLVNYAAVAKILKKHDKLTGSRLRAPVLASVLHQPFLSTESISQLVKAAEQHVQELIALCGSGDAAVDADDSGEADTEILAAAPCEDGEEGDGGTEPGSSHVAIYKRTRAALHMLSDMQTTAHTPSTLLPSSAAASEAPEGKKQRGGRSSPPASSSRSRRWRCARTECHGADAPAGAPQLGGWAAGRLPS